MNVRKSALTLLSLLIVLSAAYTGYWFYAREIAIRSIDAWATQRRAEGYDVAYETPQVSGYPLLVRTVLDRPKLGRSGFVWRGERLEIELQPWNFQRVRIDLDGKHWIEREDAAERIVLSPSEAAIVAQFSDRGRMADASLLLRDLQMLDPGGKPVLRAAEIWLEAAAPDRAPTGHTETSLDLSLSAADILLPKTADGPLGRSVEKIRADLQVRGAVRNGEIDAALEAWRRSGGTVDVDWFHLAWGEFDLRATGTIALDAQARPLGAFSTDIRGHNRALDALVAHAGLKQNAATVAKVALSLLAKPPPEGGAPVLTVPVTAQDGHLYAGPLKILDLAPVRFRARPH